MEKIFKALTVSSLNGNTPEMGMRQGKDCFVSDSGAFSSAVFEGVFSSAFFFAASLGALGGDSVSCLVLRGRSLKKEPF